MTDKIYNVLFLCTGNSARSVIAEALMNREGRGRFKAFSAGSMPTGRVNPHTRPIVESLGFDFGDFRSKSWEEFAQPGAPVLDFIFTVCDNAAGEVCPVWPGQPMTAHWGVPDPAAVEGSEAEIGAAFSETARLLGNRIRLFLNLPLDKLDRMSLQARLRQIGEAAHETNPAQ
ncbi:MULTISPECIES: arsenate reductase ArsC [unclassified Phenylobacterium]|uniref:arsenate reductase ArsC n=1 Tax=unclassified Phenylobacterium TaxID=2640670 RepID=UPI00086C104C|nr:MULTISPECIES: arsenate reductase ArsC [unclassified Phenylobacterium]ODT87381.1 MAG: ArsR family transcriptional regulator [Phenylobacterium sp. SCN 70-31]WGU41408.1 arsenate reductase ArsC [Phenylobacterium sp. NIBR 498073]